MEDSMVGAITWTEYSGTSTSTLKMFKYKYKYRVLQNVLGKCTWVQLPLSTKYKCIIQPIKNIPVNA